MPFSTATLIALAAFCICKACLGFYRSGFDRGLDRGLEQGGLTVLKDVCEGNIGVVDGRLVFNTESGFAFYDSEGNALKEVEVRDLNFYRE